MKKLLNKIQTKVPLTKDLEQVITDYFKLEIVPKNSLLLREDQYCRKLYFLETGIVRNFYLAKEKDVSSWFYREDQFFTAWYSFHSQIASFEGMETLEDSRLYSISYEDYARLAVQNTLFGRFGRTLAEEQLGFIDYYSKGYMFMSAKERYELLLDYFPDIELRVKLGHIASYLGISQETLSRIRKR